MMSTATSQSATPALSDPFRASRDASRIANLLGALADLLDAKGSASSLTRIIAACDAAIVESLEAARDRKEEPAQPTSHELTVLARMLQRAEPDDAVVLLRQIRRLLGRVDMRVDTRE
jgi:hypothetical protein